MQVTSLFLELVVTGLNRSVGISLPENRPTRNNLLNIIENIWVIVLMLSTSYDVEGLHFLRYTITLFFLKATASRRPTRIVYVNLICVLPLSQLIIVWRASGPASVDVVLNGNHL